MRIKQVCVLGGSGFLGSAIVHKLSAAGYDIKVLTRRREASKHLILLPYVQVVECDIFNDAALTQQLSGSDAVINLIGLLQESDKVSFETAHIELPRRVAVICSKLGIKRLLHTSALPASQDASSAYLRTKAAGEAAVLAFASDINVTIFRPSLIFGRGDSFIGMFAKLIKVLPVIMLIKPDAKFQPIWVEDVAQAFVNSLGNIETYGQRYDLGGPRVYSLREIVEFVIFVMGKKRKVIGLNDKLSYYQAYAMEKLPIKLLTRDNLHSLEVDSVCDGAISPTLDVQPAALEAIVPDYLVNDNPRNLYNKFRGLAGR
ncbi:epimerase [Methylovorus sp. MM2]|uniref:complex I NDUFA9 subunit family protein n=1 Tax=Methylovorus sp. MM2 TaxID=1848038 RepID=UPI0007E034A1|nr:complex I NDUFA9 subunit family protein [Methylovorus sp. MM2]OAM52337.1 epimerase [Methylovorus sp. MM2]